MLRLQRAWRKGLAEGSRLCISPRYRNRCALLLKHDVLDVFNQAIPVTNNEAQRSLRSYVLWRKGSYGVWSLQSELFRQRILTIVESCHKLGGNPLEWLRDTVRSVIEKSTYPSFLRIGCLKSIAPGELLQNHLNKAMWLPFKSVPAITDVCFL
jgi:transposase